MNESFEKKKGRFQALSDALKGTVRIHGDFDRCSEEWIDGYIDESRRIISLHEGGPEILSAIDGSPAGAAECLPAQRDGE